VRKAPAQVTDVADVLAALRQGALLRIHFGKGDREYWLSDGRKVRERAAQAAIADASIVAADPGLFGCPQSWKWGP
jgi:hypothetical protein